MKSTMVGIYNVALGQSSKLMKNKLEAWEEFKQVDDDHDPVRLLTYIKTLSCQHDTIVPTHDAKDIAIRNFYTYRQPDNDSNITHTKNIKSLYDIIKHYKGEIADVDAVKREMELDKSLSLEKASERAVNRILGLATL